MNRFKKPHADAASYLDDHAKFVEYFGQPSLAEAMQRCAEAFRRFQSEAWRYLLREQFDNTDPRI